MKLWIIGRANASQVLSDVRDFIKHGYEIIKPKKSEKVRSITTNSLFGRRRKRRKIITTAQIDIKEREGEIVGIVTTGHTRSKKTKSDSPFQFSKRDWR